MTIDVISMVIGGILWELLSAYIYCVIKPKIRKLKNDQQKSKDGDTPHDHEAYQGTTMGFTDTTK
jgi:hypothetical protein